VQCVTVRCRPNNSFGCNVAGGSRPVLDHERGSELPGQPLGNQASVNVIRATGGKANDDAHRSHRIGLRPCQARDNQQRSSAHRQMQKLSTPGNFHGVSRSEKLPHPQEVKHVEFTAPTMSDWPVDDAANN